MSINNLSVYRISLISQRIFTNKTLQINLKQSVNIDIEILFCDEDSGRRLNTSRFMEFKLRPLSSLHNDDLKINF